ncbi:hypothetical protein [Sphingomonas sp. IC081]|uniref:hypothetical protein n=1 Tax=Sphingomonas sp. IC081 TaxID=304378 RepID=UPI00115C272D|nr:hypothetical protein [Sphingomonas sp. IC081]QDK34098.1 hypothetical protein DM450_15220 [Sphingomonas sp. IC081]
MGPEFSSGLARTGFRHRATWIDKQTVVYALADKSGSVMVPRLDWLRLANEFEDRMIPVRRVVRRITWGLPVSILAFGLLFARVVPGSGLIILLMLFGGPLALYFWNARQVQRIAADIEDRLRRYPAATPVPRDLSRTPRVLEIVGLLVVGPHLLISVAGEIGGPDFFRGTPLWGAHVGTSEVFAFAVLFALLTWPRIAIRLKRGRT